MTQPRTAPPTRTAAPGAADAPGGRRATTEPDRLLHLIGNSHIDPVWLWQWPEGYQEIRATFRSALDRMNEYPEFIFTCDSAAYYEWVEEIDPAMFEEIRRRVAEGRWELVGGWWVEPDCNLPGGESFVRQALIAQRYFLEKFGRIATVGYNVDPFGHHGMLPQLLVRSGMDSYVFMRPGPHEYRLPAPVFWWESADGARVLAYRLPHEYCAPREDLGYHLDKSIAQLPERWTEMMAFYGVGNHGGGPTRENLESIRRLDGVGAMPGLRHSTPRRFFDRVMEAAAADRVDRADRADRDGRAGGIPVVRDDLQHHAVGCYSAHSGIKRWNRRTESALAGAEAWAALATAVDGRAYPHADLNRAWKQVLFNQFHDTLGGTAIEPAYLDARDQLGEAGAIAARVENTAIQALSRRINLPTAPTTVPIVVFNHHAWPVRQTVELEFGGLKPTDGLRDETGGVVPFQPTQSYATVSSWRSRLTFEAEVPPLGWRTYVMTAASPRPVETPLRATDTVLENEHLRLELDAASGRIDRLVLREGGRDVADIGDANRSRAIVVDDTTDTWGHRTLAYRDEIGEFEATRVGLVESGPTRAIFRVESRFGESTLVEDFVLAAGSRAVEVRVLLDWRERARLLKLRYATRVTDPVAIYEIPYGTIERPANGEEEPGQRWVDVSGPLDGADGVFGLGVLNDGKYGFDVLGGELGVTAVRSPIFAHHEPATPDPTVRYQYQDQGLQRFKLALVPHRGPATEAGLTRLAIEHNEPLAVLIESFHEGDLGPTASYASVTPENVVVGALKVAADDEGLVVRLAETAGRAADARVELPGWNRSIAVAIRPWEVRTFRIPREAGAAPIETDLLERPLDAAAAANAVAGAGAREDGAAA